MRSTLLVLAGYILMFTFDPCWLLLGKMAEHPCPVNGVPFNVWSLADVGNFIIGQQQSVFNIGGLAFPAQV